jgi:hypothetical protein
VQLAFLSYIDYQIHVFGVWFLLCSHWPSLISSGMTTSSPYNNLKGVKFVALDVVVL